jgi:uncharacterized integral membrane protein (TIGR00701 family)
MVAWTLVFHIAGLVLWLGSLLAVTHILAMHTEETSPDARRTLGRLESKLLRGLAHPGAALLVTTGWILVAHEPGYLRQRWFLAKLLLVVILVALDLRVSFRAAAFREGKTEMTRRECTALHGAISLVFFVILILVLTKPFGLIRLRALSIFDCRFASAIKAAIDNRKSAMAEIGGQLGENYDQQQWSGACGRRVHHLRRGGQCV